MNRNILHAGLDVDDTQYHGSAFNRETGEVIDFRCRPTLKGLLTQLDKLQRHFRGCSIRLCYEASYIGYCLQRDLRAQGVHCDVVAPSSIPSPRGKAVKTDRIDAGHLAQFYAKSLSTTRRERCARLQQSDVNGCGNCPRTKRSAKKKPHLCGWGFQHSRRAFCGFRRQAKEAKCGW